MVGHNPSGTRSKHSGGVGHQCDLLRLDFQHKIHKLGGGIPLDIEFGLHQRAQMENILTAYMPLIRAGMHRDAISPERLTVNSHLPHVGHILTTGIAQSGHFVDIDTQISCHIPSIKTSHFPVNKKSKI